MKIILSRKGFDGDYGKTASPILPDGTMLSMPIPNKMDVLAKYSGIYFENHSYAKYLTDLRPKRKNHWEKWYCHLDPDIRKGTLRNNNWKPAFGQEGGPETHLIDEGVLPGDLFLFFGWFRKTINNEGKLKYSGPNIQVIYGYLQYGEKLTGDEIYSWHPHSGEHHKKYKNNAIYIPSDRLIIGEEDFGLGYGVFKFNPILQLTKPDETRSKWSILPWMNSELKMTHHTPASIKEGYFQSAKRGQEFVIDANEEILTWVKSLFTSQ